MEINKITPNKLQEIFDNLKNGSIDTRGIYLLNNLRIQISKYKASGAERTSRLYHKRREKGMCIRCGTIVLEKNLRTGKLYRLCVAHRSQIDQKAEVKSNSRKKVAKGGIKANNKKPGRSLTKNNNKN